MRTTRVFLVTLLFAGASAFGATGNAAPTRGGAPERVPLAGKTVITGSKAAVIDVSIPTPAVWSGSPKDITIKGGGELPGFLLTKSATSTYNHPILGPIESKYEDIIASGTRLPAKGVTKKWSAQDRTLLMMPGKEVLKPGDYRLYLVADGAPVRVTIELKGLLGSTRIKPSNKIGLDMKLLPERTNLSVPVEGLYTAGDDDVLERNGLVFDALVVEVKDSPEGEIGSCVYRGEPVDEEQGEAFSYGPHCIGAMPDRDYVSTSFHWTSTVGGGSYMMMYGYVSGLDADTWTASSWYRGTGTIGGAAAYGYWLNLK